MLAVVKNLGVSVTAFAGDQVDEVAELADALDSKFPRRRFPEVSFPFKKHAQNPHGYWLQSTSKKQRCFQLEARKSADCDSETVAKSVAKNLRTTGVVSPNARTQSTHRVWCLQAREGDLQNATWSTPSHASSIARETKMNRATDY